MGETMKFNEAAGRQNEGAIRTAISGVASKAISSALRSNLTAIDNGKACSNSQKTEIQECKDNLRADVDHIATLSQSFVSMDQQQGQKNKNMLSSGLKKG